jgi:hypothetical protein
MSFLLALLLAGSLLPLQAAAVAHPKRGGWENPVPPGYARPPRTPKPPPSNAYTSFGSQQAVGSTVDQAT